MDYHFICIRLFVIVIVLTSYAKSMDKLETSAESEQPSQPDKGADIGLDEENDDTILAQSKERSTAEFLTFSAPEEDEDEAKIDDLLQLLKPHRIFLIEQPENATVIEFNANPEDIGEQQDADTSGASEKITTPTEE